MTRTRIKVCGCTQAADVGLLVDAGVDAIGVILAEDSPRRVSIERLREIAAATPAFVSVVAVFIDPSSPFVDEALKVGAIPQFHGFESADACESMAAGPYIKAFHVAAEAEHDAAWFDRFAAPYEHATWLFDTAVAGGRSGGTGRTFDPSLARMLAGDRRIVMSGGLTPENVGEIVRLVRPYAVDVRSGVETNGEKDPARVRAFIRAVRAADASLESES